MVKERVQTWFHFRGLETLLNKFNALIVEKFLFLPSHEIFSAFLVQDFSFMVLLHDNGRPMIFHYGLYEVTFYVPDNVRPDVSRACLQYLMSRAVFPVMKCRPTLHLF